MIEVVTNELVRNLSFRDRRAYGETGFFHPLTLSLSHALSLSGSWEIVDLLLWGGECVCVFLWDLRCFDAITCFARWDLTFF